METEKSFINLKSYKVEKQYKKFYLTGNIELANDLKYIRKNLKREYTKAWIKLLSHNLNNK